MITERPSLDHLKHRGNKKENLYRKGESKQRQKNDNEKRQNHSINETRCINNNNKYFQ